MGDTCYAVVSSERVKVAAVDVQPQDEGVVASLRPSGKKDRVQLPRVLSSASERAKRRQKRD